MDFRAKPTGTGDFPRSNRMLFVLTGRSGLSTIDGLVARPAILCGEGDAVSRGGGNTVRPLWHLANLTARLLVLDGPMAPGPSGFRA
jgi:hypothetical protein